jgi:hypothetical protein
MTTGSAVEDSGRVREIPGVTIKVLETMKKTTS